MEHTSIAVTFTVLIVLIGSTGLKSFAHVEGIFVIDEYRNPERKGKLVALKHNVAVPKNKEYLENCADCHIAYSNVLLSARS